MTPNEYQKAAMRTASPKCYNLSNVGLGLAGEAGEVADIIKKHLHQGHVLDKEKIAEELGDVAWYLALGCAMIGYDFETVLSMNVDKLWKRYPDGFDVEHSIHREQHESRCNGDAAMQDLLEEIFSRNHGG